MMKRILTEKREEVKAKCLLFLEFNGRICPSLPLSLPTQ
nr:MAG TPA: hypothetical protein [Caudoviricetes sp.]